MKLLINNIKQINKKKRSNKINKYIKSLEESNNFLESIYFSISSLNEKINEINNIQKSFNYSQYKETHTLNVVKENMLLCIELQKVIIFINKKEKNSKSDKIELFINILNNKIEDYPLSKSNIDTFMYLININIILKGILKNRLYDTKEIMNLSYPEVIKAVNSIDNLLEEFIIKFIIKKLPKFFNLFINKIYLKGLTYLISLLETLDDIYIKINKTEIINNDVIESQLINFSNKKYGIYFDITEKYYFFPIKEEEELIPYKVLKRDIPKIIKCYKPIFLKNIIIKTTEKILNENLLKLSFKEIIEKIKLIKNFLIHKDIKLIYLNKIHYFLTNILIRNIKSNEILGLFEFNTEYINILETSNNNKYSICIFGRDLIINKKSELLNRYIKSIKLNMKEWLNNIYSSILEKYNNREILTSMNSENKLILSEFITISNIISEQIEPTTFNKEIIEAVSNTICIECNIFKNKLIDMFNKDIIIINNLSNNEGFFKGILSNKKEEKDLIENIFEKNKNNEIKPGFEEYLIAIINSSKSIIETCNSFPQLFEIQLLSDVFNSLIEKCLNILCLNICSLFFIPLNNKSLNNKLIIKNNILPSFNESNLLRKVPPTIKDFFNDYLEVMELDSFNNLFIQTTRKLDDIYFNQFIYFFPLNISFNNRKEFSLKILNNDLNILNSIYETDLKLIKEFIESQSIEISLIEIRRVIKRFNKNGLIKLIHKDINKFETEGFL